MIGSSILSAILAAVSFAGGIAKAVGAYFNWQRDRDLREDGARRVAGTLHGKTEEIKRVSDEIDARPMPASWRGIADRLRGRNPDQPKH